MIVLPIKRKWFCMIMSGEKREEYRKLGTYWGARLLNVKPGDDFLAEFRNGYGRDVPRFQAVCQYRIGRNAKSKWGGVPGVPCFIIKVCGILKEVKNEER